MKNIGNFIIEKKGLKLFYDSRLIKLFTLFLSVTFVLKSVNAAQYICSGWQYDDGSSENRFFKFEFYGTSAEISGLPYLARGNSYDFYNNIEEIFFTLDRNKMDGKIPLRTYNIILAPCTGGSIEEYSLKVNGNYNNCKKHELVRYEPLAINTWKLGMQKSFCEKL